MQLNPSFAQSSTGRSYHAVMVGDFETAKSYLRSAMRLRVGDAGLGLCLPAKALADLHLGNTGEALKTAHWSVRLAPRFWLGRLVLAACLGAEGQLDDARDVVADLKQSYPGVSGSEFANWFPYAETDMVEPIMSTLAQAGWS